jgi:hypothetical protein
MANKKIVSRIFGGVGNQLFIYASSRALSFRTNTSLSLERNTGFLKDNYRRAYRLNQFNIIARQCSWIDSLYFLTRNRMSLLRSLLFSNARNIKESDPSQLHSDILTEKITRPTYMEGYWQSPLYFQGFEEEIRKELSFKGPFSEKNNEIAQIISSKNSIAIHVRRVQYNEKLDVDYYIKGINLLIEKIESPSFYIFSDDISWCKEEMKIDAPCYYIDHNDDEIADLYLMTRCKHFIIANSSFSWWGAWLSQYEHKVVVAPLNPGIGVRNHFYPHDWLLH